MDEKALLLLNVMTSSCHFCQNTFQFCLQPANFLFFLPESLEKVCFVLTYETQVDLVSQEKQRKRLEPSRNDFLFAAELSNCAYAKATCQSY